MTRYPVRLLASAIFVACTVACATSARTSPAGSASRRNSIDATEIRSSNATNLLEAVRQLRPEWLQRASSGVRSIRGGSTGAGGDELNVYVDNVRYAGTSVLSQMNPDGVSTLKYFSGSEAQIRFGNGNSAGVIQIVTKGASKP